VALRSLTLGFVLMLIASMATSVWANCVADTSMTPKAQMACCKNGHDKCPMSGTAEDCCKTEAQKHEQTSVATHEIASPTIDAPVLLAVASPAVSDMPIVRAPIFVSPEDVLKRPSGPPYILHSALLI
jgi:hypothetical protein